MQRAADFHQEVADARLPQATGVMDDATALDAAVDVLNAHATAGDAPIRGFLRARKGPATWFLGRHHDLNLLERERQEAEILEQTAPREQRIGGGVCNPLIMGATWIGVTQKEDRERRVDQQHIFHGMAFFLAAITPRLLNRILGTLDAPCGAVMAKRGQRVPVWVPPQADWLGPAARGSARRVLPPRLRPFQCVWPTQPRIG
jgi:hypothetical protein